MIVFWPVIIFFKDWEIGFYENEKKFYEESGCDEIDFSNDVEHIIDSTGRVLNFHLEHNKLILTNDLINKDYIIEKYATYFKSLNRMNINVESFKNQAIYRNVSEIVSLANKYYNF
ncbi:hypothetical protein [Aliikangiella sp. IMCC44359]|uniref:hypothetical protein n=1 Tax=Aliikangiella sp. IMCC44359 TaxID=3459125 RepID=UPI00403A912E